MKPQLALRDDLAAGARQTLETVLGQAETALPGLEMAVQVPEIFN